MESAIIEFYTARQAFYLGNLPFETWKGIREQIANRVTTTGLTWEEFLEKVDLYKPTPGETEQTIDESWRFEDVTVGDEFTTEGLRGFCSGGDAYNIWEKVVKVDGEKIYLAGESSPYSAKTGHNFKTAYELCRYRKAQK